MRYVIIGKSIAGIAAVKSIRSSDARAEILMVSAERDKPYYRPGIPSLIQREDRDLSIYPGLDEAYSVITMLDRATGIDRDGKRVLLSSGRAVEFDRLLIATGSSPLIPEINGLRGAGVFPLRSAEDARNIRAVAQGRRFAVVLGGGFVGLQAAVALKQRGLSVTIIEKQDRILSEKLDRKGSSLVAAILRRGGIDIITGQQDYDVQRTGVTVRAVRLASGRVISADLIVIAVGSRPNCEAFRGNGLELRAGICVKDTLQTSLADVYAAGDVAEHRDLLDQRPAVSRSWANAEEMGRIAGSNMAGYAISYHGFLRRMHTVDLLSVPITTIGVIEPEGRDHDMYIEESGSSYRKLVFREDVMRGALFIGSSEGNDIYAYLIKNRIPVGKLKSSFVSGTFARKASPDHELPAFANTL